MEELNPQEIKALGKAVGLSIAEAELEQVANSLNAILELMAAIDEPGMNLAEPLPVTLVEEEI